MSSAKKITLKSFDGESFEVDEAVAMHSQTIKNMIEEEGCAAADNGIPLPKVRSNILAKVIEYCKKHVKFEDHPNNTIADEELKSWDAEFVNVDRDTLFDLILAAKYLNIQPLLDLTVETVSDMIRGKAPDEIRKTLGITEQSSNL